MSGIAYDNDNVFAKILRGDIPSTKIFESPSAVAILDAFPTVRGHTLLIPRATGYATLADMPEDAAASVLKDLPRLTRAVMEATGAQGVNVVQNNGAAAGQEVFHVHFHIIPRFSGDQAVRLGASAKEMISRAEATEVAALIQERLSRADADSPASPPAPGSPLAFALSAHGLILHLHQAIHSIVDTVIVRFTRLLFGRLLG